MDGGSLGGVMCGVVLAHRQRSVVYRMADGPHLDALTHACVRTHTHTHTCTPWTARQFFLSGKAMPVDRGGGAGQPVISVAARRLAAGDWLHVFPEGRVQPAGDVGAFRQVGGLCLGARLVGGLPCAAALCKVVGGLTAPLFYC